MSLQRGQDPARVQRERPHTGTLGQPVQVDGEQHVGGFRLPVRLPLVVPVVKGQVVPADARHAVSGRGYRHDPAPTRRDRRPQPVDQRVVTQMIGRELGLPAGSEQRPLGQRHDSGVVDDDVDGAARGQEPFGERPDAFLVTQVERVDLDDAAVPDAGQCLTRGVWTAGRYDYAGTGPGERARGLQPQAGVTTGDHSEPAAQVDALEYLGGRGLRPEA